MKTQFIEKGGKKEFVVIPYRDFLRMKESLEDYEDLKELRKAKADPRSAKRRPYEEFAKEAGLMK